MLSEQIDSVNYLICSKGEERYVFKFTDEYRKEVLRTLGQYAADPNLSFSWYDAAICCNEITRQGVKRVE